MNFFTLALKESTTLFTKCRFSGEHWELSRQQVSRCRWETILGRIPATALSLFREIPGLPLAVQGHHGGAERAVGVPGSPGGRCQGLEEPDYCWTEVWQEYHLHRSPLQEWQYKPEYYWVSLFCLLNLPRPCFSVDCLHCSGELTTKIIIKHFTTEI